MKTFIKKTIFHTLCICFILLTISCENKEKRMQKKVHKVIEKYIVNDLNKETILDSIQILRIDSVSDYHFVAFIIKPIIDNRLDELNYKFNHLSDSGSIEELKLKQDTEYEINKLIDKSNYYSNKLTAEILDSTNIRYYFVSTLIYTTDSNNMPSLDYYGFPITTDFHVREINELIDE
ncbi:MAG: hypothetical protein RBS13_06335 [Bacteroidales bacterium]|jgi:hypothetical protein|nr:hypothetical protein [Bacteroidales bacterium]